MENENDKYTAEPAVQPDQALERTRRCRRLTLLAALLSLAAWGLLALWVWVSVGAASVSLVLGGMGMRGAKGATRFWAITVIIASSVLLLTFAIFYIALSLLLG